MEDKYYLELLSTYKKILLTANSDMEEEEYESERVVVKSLSGKYGVLMLRKYKGDSPNYNATFIPFSYRESIYVNNEVFEHFKRLAYEIIKGE